MRRARAGIALALCLLAAASCVRPKWENPDEPPEQWRRDAYECRREAFREAERERIEDPYNRARPEHERAGSWRTLMDRHRAAKHEEELFAACMRVRGYRKVRGADGD